MPTVYLKTGVVVEVPISELGEYLHENRDNIQVRTIKRRGPVKKVYEITYEPDPLQDGQN